MENRTTEEKISEHEYVVIDTIPKKNHQKKNNLKKCNKILSIYFCVLRKK